MDRVRALALLFCFQGFLFDSGMMVVSIDVRLQVLLGLPPYVENDMSHTVIPFVDFERASRPSFVPIYPTLHVFY